jgi:hypothetical protein
MTVQELKEYIYSNLSQELDVKFMCLYYEGK